MSRGTTVPLSPVENTFPRWFGTRHVSGLFLKLKPVHAPQSTNWHASSPVLAKPPPWVNLALHGFNPRRCPQCSMLFGVGVCLVYL